MSSYTLNQTKSGKIGKYFSKAKPDICKIVNKKLGHIALLHSRIFNETI